MQPTLDDDDLPCRKIHSIDQPVFHVGPSGPVSTQIKSQFLRFPDPCKRFYLDTPDQLIDLLENFDIRFLPV